MFSDFEAYNGEVISQEEFAAAANAEPAQTPEQIAAALIEDAKAEATRIVSEARENADKIANEGLLGQLLTLEAEKQRQLDEAVETLTALTSNAIEEILGKQLPSSLASDVFKTALKRFDADKSIIVEAASDVFPRLQLLARIDQTRAPNRIKIVEKAGLEPGKIVIIDGEHRFHADAASQIETFRRAVMALNDQSKRG